VPVIVAIVLAAFVLVAVAKPWGVDDGVNTGVDGAATRPAAEPSATTEQAASAKRSATTEPSPSAATLAPTDDLIRTIAAGLVGESGRWGIGTGGADDGGLGTWVAWRPATPLPEDRSIGIRPPPSCPSSLEGPAGLRSGLVIALTVPVGLVPDWTAQAVRFDGLGRASVDGTARQISPPGNRGITYLTRSDGSAWPAGAYRFRITTSTRSRSVDACLTSR
jgi:hypothetical protein